MPLIHAFQDFVNLVSKPYFFVPLAVLLLAAGLLFKWPWTSRGGLTLLIAGGSFFALSYFDPNFRKVASAPDNVPIVGMIFIVGFYFWYAMHQARRNDARIAAGLGPEEGEDSARKVFSWPDLVYIELICLVLVSALLIVWSILLKAPLEEPANPTNSPNPAKAPWYFLGLQEMLVYFDPWLAGVVLPGLIIVGLMAIPYIDVNPKGNGYFTFKERKWEISIFLFGFLILWCTLIFIGTFLRGPNWNFFGPYEYWDPNKLEPLNNINLSEFVWVLAMPKLGVHTGLPHFFLFREIFGILFMVFYLGVVPKILARTVLRGFYEKMGPARYYVGCVLLLVMLLMPVKMFLRWTLNMKYIVAIPEFSFNI
jgi:cytochrome b/b6/petD-like protein